MSNKAGWTHQLSLVATPDPSAERIRNGVDAGTIVKKMDVRLERE